MSSTEVLDSIRRTPGVPRADRGRQVVLRMAQSCFGSGEGPCARHLFARLDQVGVAPPGISCDC